MEQVFQLLTERNALETTPFLSIHEAYAFLLNQVDILQNKCEAAERENSRLRHELQDAVLSPAATAAGTNGNNAALSAALKSEKRLRDKLEKLQEEYNAKLKAESEDQAAALKIARELSELKDLNSKQEKLIETLKADKERAERTIAHATNEMENAKANAKLAEQQYEGLKTTIRSLQEENDSVRKENRALETRLVTEKGKMVEEVSKLTDLVEALKKEVDMLRLYKKQESSRKSWFGGKSVDTAPVKVEVEPEITRKWGDFGIILPSSPKQTIKAHNVEGTCIRYDTSGNDVVATSSNDSTVRIWDVKTGTVRATLRGTIGHPIMCCDTDGNLAVGGSTDKTCRVWNIRTERMLHHLVGHQHKITCIRLISRDHQVISGSADRSLKVWDITRTTYRQTQTLRHGSKSNCVDVGTDSTVASGHMDGGIRLWDFRTGSRTTEIADIHPGGVTSVCLNPSNNFQMLTNGLDSCLKLIDVRTGAAVHTFRHADFVTSQSWSSCVLSPDGKYAIAGSNSNGLVFVWDARDGFLKSKLEGHSEGVCAIDWNRGGSSGQQVASIDRKGTMILWA